MSSSSGLVFWVASTLLAGAAALVFFGSVAASGHPFFNDIEDGGSSNPWEPFHNLSGCHMGDERPGLADIKKYLNRFGYLPDQPSNYSDSFDDALEAAIRAYQHNFHLNATGALDTPTVDLMVQPRCGVADVVNGTSTMRGRGLYTYFSGNPTWPRTQLTYAFTSTSAVPIDIATLKAIFARAFSRWSGVTTITFSEAATAQEADITIGFHSGDHGDGEPFDGVLGTLAHSYSPTDGRFHLDAAENWVATGDVAAAGSTAVDLESVAVHEIGHLLGLGHSSVEEAIMYPTIRARTRKVDLAADDVAGIQSLYGSNPSYTGTASSPATTTTTTTMRDRSNGGGVLVSRPGWARAIGGVLVGAALMVW